jgi:hypothetical protein
VTVPGGSGLDRPDDEKSIRESFHIQALLARIGEQMGFSIWLPKRDRSGVLKEWSPSETFLLDLLPLNYDETTIRTIEQIDVIWLKRRAIVRAFEVEHTTAVYSGILRMADLLALQPNMDINLHIVAPSSRREKVFQEIQRPVFSLLDRLRCRNAARSFPMITWKNSLKRNISAICRMLFLTSLAKKPSEIFRTV